LDFLRREQGNPSVSGKWSRKRLSHVAEAHLVDSCLNGINADGRWIADEPENFCA